MPSWFDAAGPLLRSRPGRAWTDVTVPDNRRLRDGWVEQQPGWWERPLAGGGAAIVHDHVDAVACVTTETAVRTRDGDLVPLGGDASLDVDRAGRVLVGRAGRLEVHAGDGRVEVVADLTDQAPDPRSAPDWAGAWPDPPRRPTV